MSLRLFAAIALPDEIAARALSVMRGAPGAKWRPRENLHITLRFFGEISERLAEDLDAALEEAAGRAAPFDIALRGAGFFGGAQPHALWLGVAQSDALLRLAERCERAARACGLKPEPRSFMPHVTVAYLAGTPLDRAALFEQRLGLFSTEPWRVDRFGIYSSFLRRNAPSVYTLEAEYALRG